MNATPAGRRFSRPARAPDGTIPDAPGTSAQQVIHVVFHTQQVAHVGAIAIKRNQLLGTLPGALWGCPGFVDRSGLLAEEGLRGS